MGSLHLVIKEHFLVYDDLLLARQLACEQLHSELRVVELESPDVLQLGALDCLAHFAHLVVKGPEGKLRSLFHSLSNY